MLRGTSRVLLITALLVVPAVQANAATITFNEGLAPFGTQLEGTAFYTPLGLAFEDSLLFGGDPRLPDDGAGITNSPSSTGVVHFLVAVNNLSLTWATSAAGVSFFATAFDAGNNVVGSFFFNGAGAPGSSNGVAFLTGSAITRLEYHDGNNTVAIDTLNFTTVPEPASMLLLGSGLAGLAARRLRARRNRA